MERDLFRQKIATGAMPPPPVPVKIKKEDLNKEGRWEDYFDSVEEITLPNTNDTFRVFRTGDKDKTTFVCLHGAGHSALSWALAAGEMKKAGTCQVVAYDCRAHGGTKTEDESDLSADKLAEDCIVLIGALQPPPPKIILVGHSMGGAIAAKAAASGRINNLVGLAVVDVVEGTALAALSGMHQILLDRPKDFGSITEAIEWSITSGTLKNIESAKVSIPPQLVHKDGRYQWRTNLFATEPFWRGWFEGLSQTFLSVRAVKMLVLAGTDRLDKDLTIAQMQGKFQLVLLPACGHTIQEDDPKKTATTLLQFQQRYRF